MPIQRYDHYGDPRMTLTDRGAFLIRDVLDRDGLFAGICEYGVYVLDDVHWTICKEGVEWDDIKPFLPAKQVDTP